MSASSWQVWVDTGGTFTDGLALDPRGRLHRAKVLSTSALRGTVARRLTADRLRIHENWSAPPDFVRGFAFRLLDDPLGESPPAGPTTVTEFDPLRGELRLSRPLGGDVRGAGFEVLSPDEAPVLAARLLTGTATDAPLRLGAMRLATTRGTNALLERSGVRTALFITAGFGDLLRIGDQQRPELFRLDVQKPQPLYEHAVEVHERLDAAGNTLVPLDEERLASDAARLVAEGFRVAAVALLHGYRNPQHERRVRAVLLEAGFTIVRCSADLAPVIRLLPRAQTAVVDAYLAPVIHSYLERVESRLDGCRLHVMTSAGGLVSSRAFTPKDSLLSGPAGGVVGAALAGSSCGFERVLTFDMGGTSTDVARYDGDFEYRFEHRVGDAALLAPALAIESVAAGGGSICWFDGHRLRVGPRSASAEPGPACYGAGGPLTLTDVNLLRGRLDPARFRIPISVERSRVELERLRREVEQRGGGTVDEETLLDGLLAIADETMADAIRRVSLRKGYDPSDHALVAFGGAGGQHACAVARRLGVRRIVIPADAGLLSALGLGHAVLERFAQRQVLRRLDEVEAEVPGLLRELEREAADAVGSEGVARSSIAVRRRIAYLRFAGQDAAVEVPADDPAKLRSSFESRYLELFGHRPEARPIELESLRVIACARSPAGAEAGASATRDERTSPGQVTPDAAREGPVSARLGEASAPAATRPSAAPGMPALDRERLTPGARFDGPCLVFEDHGTTVVEPGWRGEVAAGGALVLEALEPAQAAAAGPQPEAVRLELFTHRFTTVVREMGERLRHTAVSTNVKERMDFSCALLDRDGDLVVNAPHIPVHLGALGLCVRELRRAVAMKPGDVVVTNHPAFGGSHLPDVTVVTPVYAPEFVGYVASRAHHAEIGGSRPGSMPPSASCLAEEGVVIPPTRVVREGEPDWEAVRSLLLAGPYPTRAIEDNLSDLRAAVAANHAGARAVSALAGAHGTATLLRYMAALKDVAAQRAREALRRIGDGVYSAFEALDDGAGLRVKIALENGRASIDFAGSAPVHAGNLNATPAIVRSVVIYVLRLLIREPLPLNEGLLEPVTIRIPRGILDPPFPDDPRNAPSVGGGNVETSQRLTDTLLKALGVAACSQGTMNNVILGNDRFGYYETVCGGCGAGPGFAGADAVHSHMTNTRITDPEIVEHRYPVRVERFAVRTGSGGAGRHRGGDGVVRELSFLEDLSLSVLGQHRTVAPYGLAGGQPGRTGAQRVIRAGGRIEELKSIDERELRAGDRFVLETPGGGGFGTQGGTR